MPVTFHHVSKPRSVSYNDRVCDYQEFCVSAGKVGKRVLARRWRDSGVVELEAISGDGRTPQFVRYGRDEVRSQLDQVGARALELANKCWDMTDEDRRQRSAMFSTERE